MIDGLMIMITYKSDKEVGDGGGHDDEPNNGDLVR
jgi:hypothetical protein